VRQALRGLAEALSLDEIELNDISTAVTEAANNVVSHAYEGRPGPLEVEIGVDHGTVAVLVRDQGIGIGDAAYEPADEDAPGGIGLPVMRALARAVDFEEPAAGGTVVCMEFASEHARPPGEPLDAEQFELAPDEREDPRDAMSIAVGPPALARPVLRRVLAALAARARFSSARVALTQRLGEELVDHLVGSDTRGRLTAGITLAPRSLDLTVGPLREGSSVDGLAPYLEALAATHRVVHADSAEVLAVELVEAS
jgi:anti-sigma regulatory factor (Ser/Thr protein kinase)